MNRREQEKLEDLKAARTAKEIKDTVETAEKVEKVEKTAAVREVKSTRENLDEALYELKANTAVAVENAHAIKLLEDAINSLGVK